MIFFFMVSFLLMPATRLMPIACLLDHLDRPLKHFRRDRHADLLSGFQIDGEIEFRRLDQREIAGLFAFENLIDVFSGAPG